MTLIIAEAGINHNGSLQNALKMVDAAKDAGADIIKFQTFNPEEEVSKFAPLAEYQKKNVPAAKSQLEMIKKYYLSEEEFRIIRDYCREVGISFLSTPSDLKSIEVLKKLDVNCWKIPSNEITDFPYLREIGKTEQKVILSTGMSTLGEIEAAINVLREAGTTEISLLHCTTEYPTPYDQVNLKVISALKQKFGCEVGYSDHTQGIEVSIAAVAMGATIIEKHFTLDRNMDGPDHIASLEPQELCQLVRAIRNVEKSFGVEEKKVMECEKKNILVARKSIVARREIKKGEVFDENMITTKRPGNGISPMKWLDIIGSVAEKDYKEDEII